MRLAPPTATKDSQDSKTGGVNLTKLTNLANHHARIVTQSQIDIDDICDNPFRRSGNRRKPDEELRT